MNDKTPAYDHLEPYRVALKLEEDGKAFFLEAAKKTTSKFARRTFEFLAAEEDRHIATIKEFFASVTRGDESQLVDVGESDAEEKLVSFNETLARLEKADQPIGSDREAYEFAIKFENGAEEFYEEKLAEATHPRVKKFYKWLIAEEKMHARLLKSCLMFVDDPAEWFRMHR
jgi:rubrerythrin